MLTSKQARFVAEYLIDLNATQAAVRAGYSKKAARAVASRLLTNANVKAAVATSKAQQLKRADLTATRVLEELRRLALVDARSFWDEEGHVKAFKDLTAEQGAAIAGFEAIIKNAAAGDRHTDLVHKLKLCDKTKALDILAKHFGLLTENVHHSGTITMSWQE